MTGLTPGNAGANWSKPIDASPPIDSRFAQLQLGLDSVGNAVLVWEGDHGLQDRALSPNGALSPVQALSGPDVVNPQVGVGSNGDAVFVWEHLVAGGDQAEVRARSAAGALSSIQQLSRVAVLPQVGVDAEGGAILAWSGGSNEVRARSPDGSLSAPRLLSITPGVGNPELAVNSNGGAAFAWFGPHHHGVVGRTRLPDGTVEPSETLSTARIPVTPKVGIDDTGDAVFAWESYDGTNYHVEARALAANGVLSPTQRLGFGRHVIKEASPLPEIAVNDSGDAAFVWQTHQPDGSDHVEARIRFADGTLGPTRTVSRGDYGPRPVLGIDASGKALVVWQHWTGAGYRVQARALFPSGSLGPLRTLSAAAKNQPAPQLAVNPQGHAVALWAGGTRLKASLGP